MPTQSFLFFALPPRQILVPLTPDNYHFGVIKIVVIFFEFLSANKKTYLTSFLMTCIMVYDMIGNIIYSTDNHKSDVTNVNSFLSNTYFLIIAIKESIL